MSLFVTGGQDSGSASELWSSPDGITWTARLTTADVLWSAVSYSSSLSLFIAVGNTSTDAIISTSPDGITWTSRSVPSSAGAALYAVDCGNPSRCVAVGGTASNDTFILTSTNGLSWTQQTSPAAAFLDGVTYGAGLHVAVGILNAGGGLIISSSDGATWTGRTPNPADCQINAVAFDGSQFIAVGNPASFGNPPPIMTSADGITWADATSGTIPDGTLNGIACSSTQTIAVGRFNGSPSTPGIVTFDGATWTDRSPSIGGGQLFSVSYIGTTWVAVGDTGGATPENLILLSTDDGLTWARQTAAVTNGNLYGIVGFLTSTTNGGARSMLAFWLGGASMVSTTPSTGGGDWLILMRRRLRR